MYGFAILSFRGSGQAIAAPTLKRSSSRQFQTLEDTMLKIVATDVRTGEEILLFHWTRDADSGIERAKRDAVKFGMFEFLTGYRAEPA
jgi:hypothetical protein